jgi:DNA-binding beta-propeller fold protein YncE
MIADGAISPPVAAPPAVPTEAEPEPDRSRRRRKLLLLLALGALLVGLLLVVIWYLVFRQPINPLPPIQSGAVMPSYATSIYGTKRPTGVAVNQAGDRIYVTETGGAHLARVFDAAGNELARLEPPASTGTDHVPVYLAIDPLTGEVYVTDRPTGSIYIYDAQGRFLRAYRPAAALNGWQPLGIAFDSAGNLYVTDLSSAAARVIVLDRNANVVRTIGVGEALSFPNGVAVDAAGNVYVTDSNNGRLLVFGPNGVVAAQIGRGVGEGNLGLPRGAVIDGQGRLYVVDASGQAVFVYGLLDPKVERLAYLGFFGGEGVSDGLFEYPNGIAADGRGRLYVTDSVNDRVQVWSY